MPDEWNNPSETPNIVTNLDIELLKREVGQRFPFYELKYNLNNAAFFCRVDEVTLEENFDELRRSLSEKGYIPLLRYEKGEHIIYVIRKTKEKRRSKWINITLLCITIITTIITGSIVYMGYFGIYSFTENGSIIVHIPDILNIFNFENLFFGAVLFALPLMLILITHEMGHYYISRKHGIATSLPYFLPIPPVLPDFNVGTFGALISSREPMPDKKALFDVGIAGPLAGFLVAIPITVIGVATAKVVPVVPLNTLPSGTAVFNSSLLIELISKVVLNIPKGFTIDMNPILFAGWVGLLITSINLLPAGQLDGGHIFRAFLGNKQKYAGWVAIFIMILTGWLFFAFILIFLMGMTHPPPLNDDTKLDTKRKLLFFVAIIILVLCYIPYPMYVA